MTAEEAMTELWGILCPDCGPENWAAIVREVRDRLMIEAFEFELGQVLRHKAPPSGRLEARYHVLMREAAHDERGREDWYACREVLIDGTVSRDVVRLLGCEVEAVPEGELLRGRITGEGVG